MLQPIDSQRYLRQMTLSGFGEAGQAALQAARVLLIGAVSYTHLTLPTIA